MLHNIFKHFFFKVKFFKFACMKKIKYSDIMDLGFKEKFIDDDMFFYEFGFQYTQITYKLTKLISLDWEKETQICSIIRIDNKKKMNIMGKEEINGLIGVEKLIEFFTDNTNEQTFC